MSEQKKILVIGASVAGPALCYWLKKFGFSTTLIERNTQLRKGGYAIDIRGIAIDIAKKMGIYEQVCAQRTQVKKSIYVDAQGNTLHEEYGEAVGFRQGEEVEILRGDLVEILMHKIKDIPCRFGQVVEKIEQSSECVSVTFSNGTIEQYDFVIGADGLHSYTRQEIFSSSKYQLKDLGCYICVFTLPNYLKLNQTEIAFEKDQKFSSVTHYHDPKKSQAGFMFRSTEHLKDIRNIAEQKSFLRKNFTNLGWETNNILEYVDKSDDFYFDSITQVKMDSWTKGRLALVGDAGYCASPLSGQGTSLALVGAYILAGELHAAGAHYARAFEQYNRLLHTYVIANQEFGYWVSETFLTKEPLSSEIAMQRSENIMQKINLAANAISLPEYL